MLEAAAMPLPVLPEELVCEILLRLSVRSLLQFKCVCKSWKTLISGSQFVKNHLQLSTSDPTMTNQQLVFTPWKHPWEIVFYTLKHLFQNQSTPVKPGTFSDTKKNFYTIIGSCYGLLCLTDISPRRVRLCNPSLRLISKLISKRSSVPISQDWFISHCGFGYDQVNDKYKVLLVVKIEDEVVKDHYHTLTKIYTFGHDDSWRTIPNSPFDIRGHFGIFVSGTLNWLLFNQKTFVSFDIDKETYMELLLPQNDVDNNVGISRRLFVLRNCLCLSDGIADENVHWVLWTMKEYGVHESWTKFIIIPREKLPQNRPCLVQPLFISQNGVLIVLINNSQLIQYNTNTGAASITRKTLGIYPHLHCESLVPLPC